MNTVEYWKARAEAAEAALKEAQEQGPIKYLYRVIDCFGHDVLRDDPKGATILETIPLYARPVPAPAVAVPANQLLLDILLKTRPLITCVSGNGKPKVQMQFSSLANAQDWYGSVINALLQSAPHPTNGDAK